MFLTITPNACLDRVLFIDRFVAESTMRTRKAIDSVGGKGFDVSVALRCMWQETLAVGFKAGAVGAALAALVGSYGIQTDLVEVPGETRIAHVIVEEALHRHSHVTTRGYSVSPAAYDSLLDRIRSHLSRCAWVYAGGSLPEGMPEDCCQTITRLVHEHGKPVLLDVSGSPAWLALPSRPEILKMNRQEFQATFDKNPASMDELAEAAATLAAARGLSAFVITCGREGILAVTPQSTTLTRGPQMQEVNAAGAGDAASAALMWRLSQGDDWSQSLRWAAAAGAATLLTEATAESDLQTIKELLPKIEQKQF